jgi:hypothetical protein
MDDATMAIFTQGVGSSSLMMIRCLYLVHENGKLMRYNSFKEFAQDVSDYLHISTNMSKDERLKLTATMIGEVQSNAF